MWLTTQLDPAIWPTYAASAARVLRRRLRGPRRYAGGAAAICEAVIDACWDGEHYCASAGHFRQAWTRDQAFAAPSLVRLGHRDRLHASLAWMLDVWREKNHVTTTIMGRRAARDVWTLGVDSLPLLFHSLRAAEADDLVDAHAGWLATDIDHYARTVLDASTGLVRDDRAFSTHRDTLRCRSNAYANTMVLLLDRHLRETGWLPSPFPDGLVDRFLETFWRDDHFVDRPDTGEITGDGTVSPFFFEVVPDSLGLRSALAAAEDAGLATPLPLRYSSTRDPGAEDPMTRRFVPDYQGTAIWSSLGAMYLRLLQRADPAAARPVTAEYRRIVERDGTVTEVFDGRAEGLRPYHGTFSIFVADEAMLWGAILAEAFAQEG